MMFRLNFENHLFFMRHNTVLGLTIVDSMLDPKEPPLLFNLAKHLDSFIFNSVTHFFFYLYYSKYMWFLI